MTEATHKISRSISADREEIISSFIHFVLPEVTIFNPFQTVSWPVLFNGQLFLWRAVFLALILWLSIVTCVLVSSWAVLHPFFALF